MGVSVDSARLATVPAVEVLVARSTDGFEVAEVAEVDRAGGGAAAPHRLADLAALADFVAAHERAHRPRWVWADTTDLYPELLGCGVSVERATDLRLCHRILRVARSAAGSALAGAPASPWDESPSLPDDRPPSLLDERPLGRPTLADVAAEADAQERAVAGSAAPGRLRLLRRAESVGALIAAEIHHVGLPWSATVHDRQLTEALGPRPPAGHRPPVLQGLADEVRAALGVPQLNPDSPGELLRALRRAGLDVRSTRRHELADLDHPVIEPLLAYKRLARLHAANGWAWLDTWVSGGRFHPDYVPGGVVTGRWATRGGGALQIPKSVRSAVVAEPGMTLVVADVAQLEPRMLAAMAADPAMLDACRHVDLYDDVVARGVVATRQQAKIGMLAAMYGGTTGEAGELLARMRRAFPGALALVDEAARAGERFEQVETWLGRTSPPPGDRWQSIQQRAYADDADERDHQRARSQGRGWGRFTRNFVVQGTAAEWALCWMGALRRRLRAMTVSPPPELVYVLHDEVIVHAPTAQAGAVVAALHDAADEARRLMFPGVDLAVPLSVDVVDDYGQAG